MPEPSAELSEESGRVVRSALEAFNGGDTERFLEHFTEDMHFWMNGNHQFSGLVESKAAFVELVGRVMVGLDGGMTLEVENLIAAGNWVVTETVGSAKTAAGEPYKNRYCMLWRVLNSKIVEFKEYNDSALVVEKFPQ